MRPQSPLPYDESQRLKELLLYKILDSAKEKDFDELVVLTAQICDCPMAAISFVEVDRQWIKAAWGADVVEVPRELSFCTFTIQQDEVFVVEDATLDERFAANPLVTGEPHIRFYAAAPVYSPGGFKLGTICIVDSKPRSCTPSQRAALQLISRQVSSLLELRLKNLLLQEHTKTLLLETEQGFESFFAQDALPKWIYEVETVKILQVNEAAIRKYGFTREEFMNLTVADIRDEEGLKNIHQLVQQLNGEEHTVTFRTTHNKKDGEKMHVEVTLQNILFRGVRARMATMLDITEQVKLEERLKKERTRSKQKISQESLRARQQERELIGEELHDNINQILAGTKLLLEVASAHEELRQEMIRRCRENITEAMEEIRLLSRTLVTQREEAFNLLSSVEELIDTYSISGVFEVQFTHEGAVEQLPDDLKLTLFRIIQEQLHNISKHARASVVWLTLRLDDKVSLIIRDNGKGFDPAKEREGIGLRNIRNRASFYNGVVTITSAPGEGCTIRIDLPASPLQMAV
jgi:PAS domain S-box-containing protein